MVPPCAGRESVLELAVESRGPVAPDMLERLSQIACSLKIHPDRLPRSRNQLSTVFVA